MGYVFERKNLGKKTIISGLLIFVSLFLSSQGIITESQNNKDLSVVEIQSIIDTLGDGLTEKQIVENKIVEDYHKHKFKSFNTGIVLKNVLVFLAGGAVTSSVFLVYAAMNEFGANISGYPSATAHYIYRNILNIGAVGGALTAITFDILEYLNLKNKNAEENGKE
jgi:hypothetical protein